MESERIPRSTSFHHNMRSRSKAPASSFDLPPDRSYSRAGSMCSSMGGGGENSTGVSPMRSPMPAFRSKLISFPGDENTDPAYSNLTQPTPLKMREERPDYHTSTAESALKGPRTVPALVPQQQRVPAVDPYNPQTSYKAKGILVDSPRHQPTAASTYRGPLSPLGAAGANNCASMYAGRSATPPPAVGRRASSSSMTPRRRRAKDKREEAEQNMAFYEDSFVEEFVLSAKEEISAKERAERKLTEPSLINHASGASTTKASSILTKEKERLRGGKHRTSSNSRRHSKRHHRSSNRRSKDNSPQDSGASGSDNMDDDPVNVAIFSSSDDSDSIDMRSNTSRRSDRHRHKSSSHKVDSKHRRHHHRSSVAESDEEERVVDPEDEYQALQHARRSASRKVLQQPSSHRKHPSNTKRARSVDISDMDEMSNDVAESSYSSSSSEDYTDGKGGRRHRRHRRHHHSAPTTTTSAASGSILMNAVDVNKPAPRRRGPRRDSIVAFTDSHPLVAGNDKPIRGGRSPSVRSNDGDAPVVLGRQRGGASKKVTAVSEEPQDLLGRLQSVERPVLLGRSRRAANLMEEEVNHRTNTIAAASAVPVPRQRKTAAARKAATTTTTNTFDDFLGLAADDDGDASTPIRQQPSHHANILQAASRHNTAKSSGIKSSDPMAVFFESAFPTPSRFDEMAGMASAPPVGRKKNNGNFPLMLPTTIAKGSKRK